jgi:uncharacterized protein YdhG (YjbR/CyaY superfamily)
MMFKKCFKNSGILSNQLLLKAEERIAYRIPIFRLQRDLVGFSAQRNPQKRLCSFYTMSPRLIKAMKKDLQGYKVSGATIHFTPEKPLLTALVKKIVRARVQELSGVARKLNDD